MGYRFLYKGVVRVLIDQASERLEERNDRTKLTDRKSETQSQQLRSVAEDETILEVCIL